MIAVVALAVGAAAAAQTVWRFEAADAGTWTRRTAAPRVATRLVSEPFQNNLSASASAACCRVNSFSSVKKCYNLSVASIRTSVPFFDWLRI